MLCFFSLPPSRTGLGGGESFAGFGTTLFGQQGWKSHLTRPGLVVRGAVLRSASLALSLPSPLAGGPPQLFLVLRSQLCWDYLSRCWGSCVEKKAEGAWLVGHSVRCAACNISLSLRGSALATARPARSALPPCPFPAAPRLHALEQRNTVPRRTLCAFCWCAEALCRDPFGRSAAWGTV